MDVVIDKSYLQAAPTAKLLTLCGEHTALFTETLLYELLMTDQKVRTACFEKLSKTNEALVLIPCTGPLFRYEMDKLRSAWPLADHRVHVTFENLVTGGFSYSPNQQSTLAQWQNEIECEVATFRDVATELSAWCPALRDAPSSALSSECEDLKQQACADPNIVRIVYRSLGHDGFPDASLLEPSWTLFRWVQMHILFGLDYIRRYGFADFAAVPKRVEHDVHDLQYAMFGALCGALATKDAALTKNFTMACPDGVVMS